jgi:molecular chaperone HscB
MTKKLKCWHCASPLSEADLFCPSCSKIQPPGQIDHFIRLSMPYDFDLGIKNLEVSYFSLQTKLHPDRFAQKSEKEKLFSMQQSMSINEAYTIIRNPLFRAEYMLALQGIIVNTDNSNVKPSQDILLESMKDRERLEQSRTDDEMRALKIETLEAQLSAIDAIKHGFIESKLEEAAQNTIKLRYLEKLIEEMRKRPEATNH